METIQHIIIDDTLSRVGDAQFADYLCHAYCYDGYCTFQRNGQSFRFEAGDCLIIVRRGDLVINLKEGEDFRVDVIYVTQKFIELSMQLMKVNTNGANKMVKVSQYLTVIRL